ncbi:hypothetical protein [Actibacterium mucosum]|uniref:hypothetical protein n=1 Tax=Actibacterium mucosum TaxID=1087332 RepID=UPI001377D77A|nr:hypothetical protein [Actibacterium mucosum]
MTNQMRVLSDATLEAMENRFVPGAWIFPFATAGGLIWAALIWAVLSVSGLTG